MTTKERQTERDKKIDRERDRQTKRERERHREGEREIGYGAQLTSNVEVGD